MNRPKRTSPASAAGAPEPQPSAWPQERHSGEGSASALESLRKLEHNRLPPEPSGGAPDAPQGPPFQGE